MAHWPPPPAALGDPADRAIRRALYAVTADHEIFARELGAAKEAMNGDVVIDVSTLAVITLLTKRSPVLLSAFSAVRLPRPALVGIDTALSDLRRDPGS